MSEQLDAIAMFEDAIRINSSALERHSITLTRSFPAAPWVLAERGKVMQILVNLIRNSIQACNASTGVDKKILVSITSDNDTIQFSVKDNGVGIAPDNIVKVFQYGFTTKSDGHGFGVHSSANAAREMNGSLRCHSDGHLQGAEFVLTLPASVAVS
jgi:signal transduction histidine kinase